MENFDEIEEILEFERSHTQAENVQTYRIS